MPSTGPAGSNTGSYCTARSPLPVGSPAAAETAALSAAEHPPEDEEHEGADADRHEALRQRRARDAEEVDRFGFGRVDATRSFGGDRRRRRRCGVAVVRDPGNALERLLVRAAGVRRVAATRAREHV